MRRTILLLKFTAFVVLSKVCNHSLNPFFMIKRMKKEICSELKIISGLLLWQTYHLEMIHFKSLSCHGLINQCVIEYQFCSIRRSLTHEIVHVCKLRYLEIKTFDAASTLIRIVCIVYWLWNHELHGPSIKFENLKYLLLSLGF